jgi:hypothetical protein
LTPENKRNSTPGKLRTDNEFLTCISSRGRI